MRTKVIFRKESNGEILAVFPHEANEPGEIVCYAHIGQHSCCAWEYIRAETVRATAAESAALLDELFRIGYNDLEILSRLPARKFCA